MNKQVLCCECGELHRLPTYYITCQICQKTKSIREMTSNKGRVTLCKTCKKIDRDVNKLNKFLTEMSLN